MLHLFRCLVTLCLILACCFSLMIILSRTVFATRGGEIAYENSRDGNWEIYLLDVANGVTFNLTRYPSDDLDPAWSPDGNQLTFSADRDADSQPKLYVMDADGGNVRRVTSGSGGYRNPSWSPDGASLVFMLGFGQIYGMNLENGGERWLAAGFLPSLSPDETSLLYSAENTSTIDSDIYRVNLIDHRITNLTNTTTNEFGAHWSPDGSQIAFSSLRGGKTNIYVMNADGSNLRPVTRQSRNDLSPSWSPDGTQIAYASEVGAVMQLFVIDLDGTNPRQITYGTHNSHSPAWRPYSP